MSTSRTVNLTQSPSALRCGICPRLPCRIVIFFILVTAIAFAGDSHKAKVRKIEADLKAKREEILLAAVELDVSLQAHGIKSKDITVARGILDNMLKSGTWRDLSSRTTKKREAAKAFLEKYLFHANQSLAIARGQLALIKKAEYDAWARAHPEQAKLREIEKRVKAAQNAAMNAQWQAQDAQAAAERAERAAQEAQSQAAEAERRARNAQRRAQDAEDNPGINWRHPW